MAPTDAHEGALNASAMPFPVAGTYRLLLHETNPTSAASRVFDVLEVLLRYLAACVASGQMSGGDATGAQTLLSERLTLGHLIHWIRESVRDRAAVSPHGVLASVRETLLGEPTRRTAMGAIDDLIAARNRTRGHGPTLDAGASAELVRTLVPRLEELLEALQPVFRWKPLVVRAIASYDGEEYGLEALLAVGDNPFFAATTLKTDQPVPVERVYLAGAGHPLLGLFPLLRYETCTRCQGRHLFLFHSPMHGRAGFFDNTTGHSYCDTAPLAEVIAAARKGIGATRGPISRGGSRLPDQRTVLAGRYALEGEIGSGSSGKVYRARDLVTQTTVAVKLLQDAGAGEGDDPGGALGRGAAAERFARELAVMRDLNHPNIVRALDGGTGETGPYLVMEFVDGISLRTRLSQGPLELSEIVSVGLELLAALEAAHALGVVHRDLKPENILLTRDRHVKVTDFGVARVVGGAALTRKGEVVGTVGYMAPEQVEGAPVDSRTDLFAVGVLLYEMGTTRRPFIGGTFEETLAAVVRCTALKPSDVEPSLPSWFDELVGMLLQREREARPASAERVRAILAAPEEALGRPKAAKVVAVPGASLPGQIAAFGEKAAALVEEIAREGATCAQVGTGVEALFGDVQQALDQIAKSKSKDDEEVLLQEAALRSLLGIGRELERSLRAASARDGESESSAALINRLRARLVVPATGLLRRVALAGDEVRAVASSYVVFEEEGEPEERRPFAADWLALLESRDPLDQYDAAMEVCLSGARPLEDALSNASPEILEKTTQLLWRHGALLLLEMRGRAKGVFEFAERVERGEKRRFAWRLMGGLFRATAGHVWDPEVVDLVAGRLEPEEKTVVYRCLLLHGLSDYRAIGLRNMEPRDSWDVIASERVPLSTLAELWLAFRTRVADDFRKIFFVCVRERVRAAPLPQDLETCLLLLEEFFGVNAFHEGPFFRMLVSLEEYFRAEAVKYGRLVDFEERYAERLKAFLAGGVRRENAVATWSAVPLPVQRLLARRGYFLRHFVTHPNDTIALECFPHLQAMENVASFVGMPAINGHLLQELAKESRLFQWEEPRYALVANPKTPGFVLMNHLGSLRRDSLKRLSASHEVNQLARQMATKMLSRMK